MRGGNLAAGDGRDALPVWRPLAGAVIGLTALPLIPVLPEVGIPVLYLALRLLGTRYTWAGRVHQRCRGIVLRIRRWWHAWPQQTRIVWTVLASLLLIGLLAWTLLELATWIGTLA